MLKHHVALCCLVFIFDCPYIGFDSCGSENGSEVKSESNHFAERYRETDSAKEANEPPLEFVVKVGDKSITFTEGKTAQLEGVFTNPKISVTTQPYRVFPYHGINFKYPKSFSFAADISDVKNWELSGKKVKIAIVEGTKKNVTTSEVAKNIIAGFPAIGVVPKNVKFADAKITLGKQTLHGTTLHATLLTQRVVFDIYLIPSRGARTNILMFSDELDDAGNRSNEGKQTLKLLKSSFTIDQLDFPRKKKQLTHHSVYQILKKQKK